MDKSGSNQQLGIKRRTAEKIFIGIIVFGHPQAQLGVCRATTDEDLFVIHGDVLHGKHRFASKTADNEINLFAGAQQFHGIGSVGDI